MLNLKNKYSEKSLQNNYTKLSSHKTLECYVINLHYSYNKNILEISIYVREKLSMSEHLFKLT